MEKTRFVKNIRSVLAFFMAIAIVVGTVAVPEVTAISLNSEDSSNITKLEGYGSDYTEYLDSSVAFELSDKISDNEEISVIVTLDEVALMDSYEGTDKAMSFAEYVTSSDDASKIKAEISRQKAEFLNALDEKGISYKTGEEYSTVLSGFEILIKAGDFENTCKSLGNGMDAIVGEVYNTCETQVVENEVSVFDTGIFDTTDSEYDGSGMVVAVLDTGLDSNHTAFSVDNFTSDHLGLTYDEVASLMDETTAGKQLEGLTVDDVYINEKVPYGFDYADKDADVYSTHNNHGTHVSGVIVGNDDTIRGVAPNAQLVSMKIFSDIMDTARTAWIISALEDCVVLGVDVINMSIGTSCGFSRESDEEKVNGVYDKIREAGISMVVAASNSYSSAYGSEANGNLGLTSNPDTGTVGSPSTYEGVMSVASISGVETPYIEYDDNIIYFVESTDAASEENNFYDALLGDKKSMNAEFVVIPGVGRSADYTGIDVEGKIALVRRGSNTFEEKALIAQEQGAIGIIIYNNVSGDIKMNVGDAKIAVCSISQDDGEMLAAEGSGKLKINRKQTSGPFISDFSSWGPTPDLRIKPEITAHGGSILSSVTGGSYDRLSGTSMACPNLAGFVVLLRQYVVENFPEIADDNNKVNEMVYCLLMSTADIALNKNGLPYAVRKQGAGLANLTKATETQAYITTYDKDGNVMDKPKLELGDDPNKTGVYEMTFAINNISNKKVTYELGAYIMTEGVSETKTNAGETTVTEEARLLEGATFEVVSVENGKLSGDNKVKVKKGETADVTVRVTLSDEDKEYLDKSFENGMYVEGFITLEATGSTKVDMNVPYLAFYGDWTVAPLFDLTYYDTNADELDEGIDDEDKVKADAYATRPIGGVSDDYVTYLGSYYFQQDPNDMVISANENYIALSNQVGTVHSLRFVWAGLLRNAAKILITITDDTTGEVVFEKEEIDVRKSYGDGGASIYPANVEIEFDTTEYNLENNTEYTVRLEGYLDYGDGGLETNEKNVFEFPLVADFEAPTVTDVQFRSEYDKTLDKNRLYADVYVYDNHYAMSSQLGYITDGVDEDDNPITEMKAFEQYMTPIYSGRNSTTKVTYELTDYIYDIKNYATTGNSFVVNVYDYALNYATYQIELPDDFTSFNFEGLENGLVMSPNEVYTLEPTVTPDTQWAELLDFSSSKPNVVRVVNNKLVAVNSGSAIIKAQDPNTKESVIFNVTVLSKDDEDYRRYDKPVADVFTLDGFSTIKAYYILENEDKEIGDTGSSNFFEGKYSLSMYPSEMVMLTYSLDSFFPKNTTVAFESSNESIVTIDDYGTVTAVEEGFASVTIKVLLDDQSTYYSETVSVEVKDPYITNGPILSHYYGNGGLVNIPADLSLTEIGQFAFSNYEYIMKTEEELLFDDVEKSKAWFIGDNTITKVVIPEGVEKIDSYAFANLTALEEVVLPSTLEHIDYGAFYNCTSLKKISFSGENNLKVINQNAFENCNLEGTVDLSSVCVISDYAFAGNQKLKEVKFGDSILSIGQYAFAACKALTTVGVGENKVKYGAYAFTGCESLTEFYVNSAVLPEGMFYQCENLEKVTVGADVNDIGVFAFRETNISAFVIEKGNKNYKVQTADYILSANGKTIVAVSPLVSGEFTTANIGGNDVKEIGKGAFSHNQKITSVVLNSVTDIGDYGLASNKSLTSVSFGELKTIGEYAFFEAYITEMPKFTAKTKMGKYAFSFTKLTSVTIPDKMEVPEGAFSECSDLATVVIGDDVEIGSHAFSTNKDTAFDVLEYEEDGQKLFRYVFSSPLTSLTIGKNAVIGESAFLNAASLETITLGEGAEIGKMAFYNMSSLKSVDLSKVKKLGDYAIAGDVYFACLDSSMTVGAISPTGYYRYTYHGPQITSVDISSAEEVGEYALSYCRQLVDVKLSDKLEELKPYTFAGCASLKNINLENIQTIGDYAFMECALESVNLSSADEIGEYAFVQNNLLANVTLKEKGCETIGEGAFSYCTPLANVANLNKVENIGDYAFAYVALTEADLTSAVSIGKNAFMKENVTDFKVTLGDDLEKLGDNPFALCKLAPFSIVDTVKENGKEKQVTVYDYEITDTVSVIDGSLYYKNDNGLELVTFAGKEKTDVVVADDTVRITAMAFAGTDVVRVKMPYTTTAIGHKAFYKCNKLQMVNFGSHTAPIFEEEFDPSYYETYDHIPGTGSFGEYTDYNGESVEILGIGVIPYYMWNVVDGLYSNVFYGANFVDYVGFVNNKLTMVKPVNGVGYDSFICNQYFDLRIDGPAAPDDTAVDAINAIKAIPKRVVYEDKPLVEAARKAYDKIATTEQLALVTNYADLVSAEQRIKALAPTEDDKKDEVPVEQPKNNGGKVLTVIILIALVAVLITVYKKNKEKIQTVLKPVTDKLKPVTDKISKFFKPVTDKLEPVCGKVKEKVGPIIKKVAEAVKKLASKIATALKPICKKAWELLKKVGAKLVVIVKALATKIVEAVKNAKAKSQAKKQAKAEGAAAVVEAPVEPQKSVVVTEEKEEEDVENNETEN